MSDLETIARRLEAVERLDWTEVRKLFEEERYGDFWCVGPVLVPTDFHTAGDKVPAEDKAWAAEAAAVAEFLRHMVADMRLLLDRSKCKVVVGLLPGGEEIVCRREFGHDLEGGHQGYAEWSE